jgi:hypothetical protein
MYLRFAAAISALAAAAAGIVVAVLLVRSVPGPTNTSTATTPAAAAAPSAPTTIAGGRIATPGDPHFPSPPPGAIVLAQEAGTRALAIGVKPGLVRVSVLSPFGGGAAGLSVSVRPAGGRTLKAAACGAGCYQTRISRVPSELTVLLAGDAYRFQLPPHTAPSAAAIVARATDTWNALHTLVWHERLGSSPTNVLHTLYRAVAPHSLAYTIAGRSAAIIIGGTRWDRPSPTAPWSSSPQDPELRQPQPFWSGVTDARLLGTERFHGRPVWRVSFFDPKTPAWFVAKVDRANGNTLALDMIAASHFMHDVYGPFDAPIRLRPPA